MYPDRHIATANQLNILSEQHTGENNGHGDEHFDPIGDPSSACAHRGVDEHRNDNGGVNLSVHGSSGATSERNERGGMAVNERLELRPEQELEESESCQPRQDNLEGDERAEPPGKKRKDERKAAVLIASLNINGFGNLIRDHSGNKWGRIYRMMSENRIGILLLQETHLTRERVAAIHKMFAKRIRILFSMNPDAPTQRDGVAVVLKARYIKTADASAIEIIPGKAIQVTVACQGGEQKTLLCIYAPTSNGVAERKAFFENVREYYENHPQCSRPHLMAGDFNTVEDSLDRLPVHEDPEIDQSTPALDDLKLSLGLMLADGWRLTYPNTREYTFHRGTGRHAVFSRLDRIYVTPDTFDNAREWRICEAGVRTDHSLVSVQLTPKNSPVVGEGQPLFPTHLIKDRKLTRDVKDRGLEAMRELDELEASGARSNELNAQRILHRFKTAAMKMAREREKQIVPRLLAEIRERERALRQVKASKTMQEAIRIAEAEALTKQIRQLKQRRFKQQQQHSRATHRLYGERPTKYWSKLHRECAPRDIIQAFEREGLTGVAGEKIYESDSVRMAAMARVHHMNVQRDNPGEKGIEERESDIRRALDSIRVEVSEEEAGALGGEVTYDEVLLSLRFAKNGSSPGLDGIPFEFWKALHARYVEDSRHTTRKAFDIVRLLKTAFEDIRLYGVDSTTAFARGWIAPIYKEKGEKTRVVNYRPITLLNTDYKLLSKTLAVRLAEVAPRLVNKAQAGFVPGRRIHNHTQLARMMMSWAEDNDADGAIVALDQERAYDKVAHDYLWRVLEKFGIPAAFTAIIKSLYANAKTSVMVNGILSKAYQIYRGVRQGDPLSCLLFDLAIEPLSAMIRQSDLEGFSIPRCDEVLKAVLFADDTTVYLTRRDDFQTLQEVLDTWCSAAKARFNIGKTEIIPIGSPAFREEMAETYQATGRWGNYPRGVHVARDGEAVRILGAFFGNGVNQIQVWSLVLTKIVAMRKPLLEVIARWRNGHSTVQGKRHVVQMIVGGMTQFLTMVQRMPDTIRTRLNKLIREYLWDDRHTPPVALDYTYLPVGRGGLGIMDLETRNEAIDIMWLKAYLDMSKERPLWAFLADDLLAQHVTKDCRPRASELRINHFLQKWRPRARGLPDELQGMMTVAKWYGLRLEGLAFSRTILHAMPMWDHVYADRVGLGRLTVPSKLLTCLQQAHGVRTVGDFVRLAQILDAATHKPRATCNCSECANLRTTIGCLHPHLCAIRAKAMVNTLPGKWNPYARQPEDYEQGEMDSLGRELTDDTLIPFDRRVTTGGDLGQAFRIFTDNEPVSNELIETELDESGRRMTMATDGSCLMNGDKRARAGAGVFVEQAHELNQCIRLPSEIEQTNQTGEIVATLMAVSVVDERTRILQETDSQTTMDSITKWRQRHEDSGYILQKNDKLTRATIARLRMRKAHTVFRWVKGHDGHTRNEEADKLAAEGAAKEAGDSVRLEILPVYRISGAKLQSMTQRLAYRAIRTRKDQHVKDRPRTVANMDRVSSGVRAVYGVELYDEAIWMSLRTRHVSRSASQFPWMALHDGYMVGTHWLRPNMSAELQDRATCSVCGECETMTHIIFNCGAVGQKEIWTLLEQTWLLTKAEWHDPCWGMAFGAACASFKTEKGARRTAIESLWTILCTEAVHLIWKLRCERVIQREGRDFTAQEITNRYYSTMDSRLDLDRRTAALMKGKRSLKPKEVERIWLPILNEGHNLPPKWVTNSGVLVGIKRGR